MMNLRTYISLFSSAGVGCYAFKMAGFNCVATNELLERRLKIQKINNKCKYDSGYISGDITLPETQNKILDEIDFWKKNEKINKIDVLMATPPCQGMSTANYKKGDEINRNSLVIEAIHLVNKIEPRIFIFENVRAFLSTMCIDKDDEELGIKECIIKHLNEKYNIFFKVVNFMDYGIPSSRPRTLVIGTLKSELNFSPLNIFPLKKEHVTLKDSIGDLKSLSFGERDFNDLYHSFRIYPKYMQEWIHDLKEGETAFNNVKDKVPYKIVDGKKQILKSGHMGNKFCRMCWNKPAPCITTRNDQLASQTTIHPTDDRVLSIRELMRVMSIPDSFKWVENECRENVDNNETLIRQSIGEAVPTGIILAIAKNINEMLDYDDFVKKNNSDSFNVEYQKIKNNYIKAFIFEKNMANIKDTGSFFTPQLVVYNTIKNYCTSNKKIKILEPSVGLGAFIPQFIRIVDDCDEICFDLVDTSNECLIFLKELLDDFSFNKKYIFNFINDDFITYDFDIKYDAIISNPPYFKLKAYEKRKYAKYNLYNSDNIYLLFMERYQTLADDIMCVIPKTFLMTPDSNEVREVYEKNYRVSNIFDYGVHYFKDVFIEIISIYFTKTFIENQMVHLENPEANIDKFVKYNYIYHDKMWILYRDEWFDDYIKELKLDAFDFYRDRQLTNKYLSNEKGNIWVVKSKNLLDNGEIIHKLGYDRYVNTLEGFTLKKFYGKENIIFTNFTYNTRASILPSNCTVNGSFCILLPKDDKININLQIYSTKEFRKYYSIVKNLSKFTINVDANSIYYIGVKKDD